MRLALSADALRRDPRPRWVLAGAALDLDFEAGRYWAGNSVNGPEDLQGWTAGAPLINGDGLVCDGSTAWRAALPDWVRSPDEGLTIRVDVTETPGSQGVGYLVILHGGSLADRIAMLTTRAAVSTRVTRDGSETFTTAAGVNTNARYSAILGVKTGGGSLVVTGGSPAAGAPVPPPYLGSFEIGSFNASLPLKGVIHRLTFWRGRLSESLVGSLL